MNTSYIEHLLLSALALTVVSLLVLSLLFIAVQAYIAGEPVTASLLAVTAAVIGGFPFIR